MNPFTDFAASTHLPLEIIAMRMLVASLLGAVIGIEREWRKRPAGLRTHMLTALAAAVFTILTAEIFHSDLFDGDKLGDPIRVIEAVTAGVAFLAAGAIIRSGGDVKGLTTGAGMWLAGAIGVAAGLGQFAIGALAAVLGLIVMFVIGKLEVVAEERKEPVSEGRTESHST
jgi:putative Mg2+ transporter-C (MgtC) family protein